MIIFLNFNIIVMKNKGFLVKVWFVYSVKMKFYFVMMVCVVSYIYWYFYNNIYIYVCYV